jgi:Tfp pilus assembly protein PilV
MKERMQSASGFSLLEALIAIILTGIMINGILLAWTFTETQQRSLEDYWLTRSGLDMAYETTARTIRDLGHPTITIETNGINFVGTDTNTWRFYRDTVTNNYIRTKTTPGLVVTTDILLSGNCNGATFTYTTATRIATITLGVTKPVSWMGTDNLILDGSVFLRNP